MQWIPLLFLSLKLILSKIRDDSWMLGVKPGQVQDALTGLEAGAAPA